MITTSIDLAKEVLNREDIIAIPTETVYGLAGNAFSETAVNKIFALKQRPFYNPLIVHVKSVEYLDYVACNIPQIAFDLAQEFWPGPLTMVLDKKSSIPDLVTSGKSTVAIRMPNHNVALDLLSQLEFPLAAPSANPFSSISPTTAQHVHNYFGANLDVILDGGDCIKGIESTIIGFEDNRPIIYRLGSLSIEDIEKKIGNISYRTLNDTAPSAPGMLSRHYAPKTETYLTNDIGKLAKFYSDKNIGLLLFQNEIKELAGLHQEILTSSGDFEEAMRNLYSAMHRLDNLNLDLILAEKLPEIGLGKTINDKLTRATKKQYFEV